MLARDGEAGFDGKHQRWPAAALQPGCLDTGGDSLGVSFEGFADEGQRAVLSGDQVLLQGDRGATQDVRRGRVPSGVELSGQPLEVAGVLGEGGQERLGSGQDEGAGEAETVPAELLVDLGEEGADRRR